VDPFAEKKSPWPKILVLAAVLIATYLILNKLGYIYEWTNGRLGDEVITKSEKAAQSSAAVTVTVKTNDVAPAK
jgi:hypothetical protein